jgi:hypothetical protein
MAQGTASMEIHQAWAPTTQSWQLVLRRIAPRKFLIKQQLFENFE